MIYCYYRQCTITDNHQKKQRFLVTTPAKTQILLKNAATLEKCKLWIDRQLERLAIEQTVKEL